jgi:raffinose/stachyose/melibiose transport system substrate-binding protein
MKSTIRILIALLVLTMLITSCTPAATQAPAPVSPAATQPPAAAPAATQPSAAPVPTQPAASAEKIKLVVWWWGEQEAPGAQKFMDETVAKYQAAHPNVTIETVLQSTDTLIPSFQ